MLSTAALAVTSGHVAVVFFFMWEKKRGSTVSLSILEQKLKIVIFELMYLMQKLFCSL